MRVCRHCERVTLVIHLHFHSESATDYLQHWISIHLSLRYNLRDKLPTPNSFVSITLLPLFYHTDTCHRYIYIYILLEGGEGSRNWTNFALDRFSSTFERYKSRLKLTRTNFSFKKDLQYVQIIFARVTCHMSHVARGCPPKVDSSSFSSPLIGSIGGQSPMSIIFISQRIGNFARSRCNDPCIRLLSHRRRCFLSYRNERERRMHKNRRATPRDLPHTPRCPTGGGGGGVEARLGARFERTSEMAFLSRPFARASPGSMGAASR